MTTSCRKLKSPLMSQSTYLNGINGQSNENKCKQCIMYQHELDQADQLIQQLIITKNIDQVSNDIIQETRTLKKKIQELQLNEIKIKKQNTDMQRDMYSLEQKFHKDSITKGEYQRINMELKQQILQLEKQILISDQSEERMGDQQELINNLEVQVEVLNKEVNDQQAAIASKQKFVDSVLHMVISCHPQDYFQEAPSLKQAWKWLKQILQEYVYLKKVYNSKQPSDEKVKKNVKQ